MSEVLANEDGTPGEESSTREDAEWGRRTSIRGRYRNIQNILLPKWVIPIVHIAMCPVAGRTENILFSRMTIQVSSYGEVLASDTPPHIS